MNVDGKNIIILGLAREGVSLVRYLASHGAHVTVADSAPPERVRQRLTAIGYPVALLPDNAVPDALGEMDALFVSPGVPENNPIYQAARDAELSIQSMTTLFFELCAGPIVGITGSSGKTTTTGLIGHILHQAGRDVVVGGNIGDPMLDLLPQIGPATLVVLELSSFQLSILRRSPHIAVVTNISPNHLDRHGTMEEYVAAKRHIVEHQSAGDYAVLNAGDPVVCSFAAATPAAVHWFGCGVDRRVGAGVCNGYAGLANGEGFHPVMPVDHIPLLGQHNVENVLAALAASVILEVSPEAMAAGVASFRPAPHRLQTVAARDGIRYVDDSIATSPARAIVALQALDAPILLIAGGRDKHLPWEDFARLVVQKARGLFLIGEAARLIDDAVRQQLHRSGGMLRPEAIRHYSSLQEAVAAASRAAVPGDVVLLSPGCTSYDMFSNFEERGAAFTHAVEALDAVEAWR